MGRNIKNSSFSKSLIEAYIGGNTCALCGRTNIDSGRIFHGHCICSSCMSLIENMPSELSCSAAAETSPVYAG